MATRAVKSEPVKKTKVVRKKNHSSFPIVAIGASAGGLEAITQLLKVLPPKTGMAYVYIQHLTPTHESMLVPLLSKATRMRVQEAGSLLKIKPDNFYIIPPDRGLILLDGILQLTPRKKKPVINMPINQFFFSLADHKKEKAIGIVLSGSATDGTKGLKAIKEAGGITFAQDKTAKFDSMPKSAVEEGVVDYVLSPAGIAKELVRLSKHPYARQLSALEDRENEMDDNDGNLKGIIQHLSKFSGVDFSHYKITTVKRRIIRRMLLHKKHTLKEYATLLKNNAEEINALYQDMLINVTSFFRDEITYQHLKNSILPRLLKNKAGEGLRIWVPACATGEEAYSIAMLVYELLDGQSSRVPVQIFATDISENAIATARQGEYAREDVDALSPKRVQRFFTLINGKYRIIKAIRDMCVFATHNLFHDPPFSRIDLVSCCNLLIYLDSTLQRKALSSFYYALKNNGYLMLGKSETTSANPQLYIQGNKKFRIYLKKKNSDAKIMPEPAYPQPQLSVSGNHPIAGSAKSTTRENSADLGATVDNVLLTQYIPASVVVNKDLEILHFRGATGLYLHPAPGKASLNLLKMTHASLGFELRSAVHKAGKTKQAIKRQGLEIKNNQTKLIIDIEVMPLKGQWDEPLFLVVFKETPLQESLTAIAEKGGTSVKDETIKKLENELFVVREDMRSIIEEQETSNEELQSANEEVISSNEELQSVNEELETSKEELESTNEELISTNQELQTRNEQLSESYAYSEAIISTVHESLLVLDKEFKVKSANKSFYKTFKVKEEDTEHHSIFELGNGQWDIKELRDLLLDIIIKNSSFHEFELTHTFPGIGEKTMMLNAHRVIQKKEREYLILLAIEDMTERTLRANREKEEWFIDIADNAPVMIWMSGIDKHCAFVNKTWLEFRGRMLKQELGTGWSEGIHKDDMDNCQRIFNDAYLKRKPFYMEFRLLRYDGEYRWVADYGKPRFDNKGNFNGYIGSCSDIQDKKMMNEELERKIAGRTAELQEANSRLQHSNRELQQFAYIASHDLQEPLRKIITYSDKLEKQFSEELPGEANNYVDKIAASSERMSKLIQDILDFSRVTTDGKRYVPTNLNVVIKDVLVDFDEIIDRKKADVRIGKLPVIEAIPVQMTQLFHNLIGNALKFGREKPAPIIKIKSATLTKEEMLKFPALDKSKTYCQITVEDNGIGFEQKFANKIFTIFQRLEEKTKYPGNGIGLALCRKIVDNHNGIIYTQSEENKGATFYIILPVKRLEE